VDDHPSRGHARGRAVSPRRRPDAWQWPEWAYAGSDGTFGNRYDDPLGEYRVLYASSQRRGAFLETLARFRVDVSLVAELDAIEGDDRRDDLDAGDLRRRAPRAFAQEVSRHVFDNGRDRHGQPLVVGSHAFGGLREQRHPREWPSASSTSHGRSAWSRAPPAEAHWPGRPPTPCPALVATFCAATFVAVRQPVPPAAGTSVIG
jgi:hypothetical protein